MVRELPSVRRLRCSRPVRDPLQTRAQTLLCEVRTECVLECSQVSKEAKEAKEAQPQPAQGSARPWLAPSVPAPGLL